MNKLTDYERRFADEHHGIIYEYLKARSLSVNEYYDVVIFRYLGAVQRYLSDPELRETHSFKTIAYGAMRSVLSNHFKTEKRKNEFCVTNTNLVETIVGYEADDKQIDVSKLLWLEVASMLTEPEIVLVRKKADGFSYKELAKDYGLAPGTLSNRMSRLRKRICDACDVDTMLARIIG